jgi:transposase
MTYDKTTKKKILKYADENGARAAIKKFSISSATLYVWKREQEPDYIKPERKAFHRKMDPEALRIYVLENPDLTCEQFGLHFGVSYVAVYKVLKKLGFSFKKRTFFTENEMRPRESNTKKELA